MDKSDWRTISDAKIKTAIKNSVGQEELKKNTLLAVLETMQNHPKFPKELKSDLKAAKKVVQL